MFHLVKRTVGVFTMVRQAVAVKRTPEMQQYHRQVMQKTVLKQGITQL